MIELILQNLSWFWLIIAVVLTLIEVVTLGLTTIWFALGALVMIFLSFTPIPFAVQVLVWLLISSALLYFTRPYAVKKLKVGKEKTNAESLIGKKALVVKTITKFEKGEIKLNGLIWGAKSDQDEELEKDSECEVIRIEGATAVVKKV
ncbi:MAG TPA: NfeD family protein [Treponemataceae bacterium]|jgi:membrane protein implicated in regulation of membrane protease activity|nr:NfeD family protein [Treponemataceae bacterium]